MSVHAPPTVLTFSLSDPTGAGGVLADALTCASMGCHAAAVITAVAVQDSRQTEDHLLLDEEWVDDQARAVLQDMPVAAIKVGAVGSSDNAQAIAEILSDYPDLPVVFDPFPAAAGSENEPDAELMAALRELVLPQVTVLTLSLAQARSWLALAAEDEAPAGYSAAECARHLRDWGAEWVLVTRTDQPGEHVVNTLYGPEGHVQNESVERQALRFRGAGDTLSAAVAALLAQGIQVGDAVREANDYLAQALAGGFRLGMGDALPDRLFWAGDDGSDDGDEGSDEDSDEDRDEGGDRDGEGGTDDEDDAAGDPPPARH